MVAGDFLSFFQKAPFFIDLQFMKTKENVEDTLIAVFDVFCLPLNQALCTHFGLGHDFFFIEGGIFLVFIETLALHEN